jgi:hypothetical protein
MNKEKLLSARRLKAERTHEKKRLRKARRRSQGR